MKWHIHLRVTFSHGYKVGISSYLLKKALLITWRVLNSPRVAASSYGSQSQREAATQEEQKVQCYMSKWLQMLMEFMFGETASIINSLMQMLMC